MCYKMRLAEALMSSEIGIHQAPNGLGNPRETNTFVIRNRAGKWSIASVQMGNNFAHTLAKVRTWVMIRTNNATTRALTRDGYSPPVQ